MPGDWQAWLDFANLCLAKGDKDKALSALDFAVKYGGRNAEAVIAQVAQLREIYGGVGPLINRGGNKPGLRPGPYKE